MPDESMTDITFKTSFHAVLPHTVSPSVNLDSLWHLGWFLHAQNEARPSWGGFNSSVVRGSPVTASEIRLQPIIDANPNSASCIYSTLTFIIKKCEKLNIKTPMVTFDQPVC
jgi:hypothetical protein